ncbi:GH25 family lysozyme [Sphingomonas sp. S1-29]|uniref:GH25 family lysozyme n=1 Tax=Sphingomonas sp. S1-29 TaxID=2991074 RepID=UPI00223FBC39|nr:GH25 family lysozyme [Sphingomonas sp. S1-29]UZK69243.1 GH25 family lysozyme [Sphingomonas sp. S1-29]
MQFWGLGRLLIAVGAAGAIAGGGWIYAGQWQPSIEQYPVQGVDVSAATGAIDWYVARGDGVDFAYVVATQGDVSRDAAFEQHWRALPVAGVRRGALHLYAPCRPGTEQADHFNATVPRTADALPAAVAFELDPACNPAPTRGAMLGEVQAFLARVERHTGKPALLRVSPAFEAPYQLSQGIDRTFWGVRAFREPAYLARGWRMWQANPIRRVDGIERPAHWNVVAT